MDQHQEQQQQQTLFSFPCPGTNNNPLLRNHTVRPTTFTLPFARLITADRRRMFLSDCSDHRSDDDDDDDGDGGVNCAYSRPVVVLDMVWNLAFVVVAAGVLLSTLGERPSTPLRLWLCGYAFECVLHTAFVYFEYRRRIRDSSFSHSHYSIVKKLEPLNTLASSVWWAIGFYWIVVGGQDLLEDSPRLYWNAVSAYLHMLPEQNCIAFLVLTIFIVDASAGGFEQKQPVHSANLIFLELIHWFDSSLRPKLDEALRCIMTQKEYDSGERKSLLIC